MMKLLIIFHLKKININDLNNNIIKEEAILSNIIYNPNIYNFNFIYSYFKERGIFKRDNRSPVCNKIISIIKDKSFIDGICFRFCKVNPRHDIKYSIKKDSIFEKVKINLIKLYFLIYVCFLENKSTNKDEIELKKFYEYITKDNAPHNNIAKLYSILRRAINTKMHKDWSVNNLGTEPSTGGVSLIEINESKILENEKTVYWMFGMIYR